MTSGGSLRKVLAAAVFVSASVAVPPAVSAQGATEIPVLATPAGEFQPARTSNALAWERNTMARPNEYAVMVQPDGGGPIQANRPDTSAAMGDFLGDRLLYQQYRGNPRRRGRSDLFLFDVTSGARSKVAGVNSRQWEYWPSASGAWLLFGRWNPHSNVRRLMLHNLDSGERRVVEKVKGRKSFLGPGQVNGNYAVWYVCHPRCEVLRYDITARTTSAIANPGSYQRAPSVTAGGTVYFSRGGRRCGASAALVRASLQGEQQVLVELQDGLDVADTYAYTQPNGSIEVYYERNVCGRRAGSDIYKVRDVSLATLTVLVNGAGTVVGSPAGINCGTDCSEDYEIGTAVTLAAHPAPGFLFAGWDGACTGTAPCEMTMDAPKGVTATFVLAGSLRVVKEADPADGTSFVFETAPNVSGGRFALADGQSRTFASLPTGTYSVTELRHDDWKVEDIGCTGDGSDTQGEQGGRTATIALDPGEAVTCTFFNKEDD
ncbi:MAG: InlB B-repeat-containing protein [Actinomycetota bacterium]